MLRAHLRYDPELGGIPIYPNLAGYVVLTVAAIAFNDAVVASQYQIIYEALERPQKIIETFDGNFYSEVVKDFDEEHYEIMHELEGFDWIFM
jgi:hypothetical protein